MNDGSQKIIVAADHAGFQMKEKVVRYLAGEGYRVDDVGAHLLDPADDYPLYMHTASKRVSQTTGSFGLLFGGSGQGEAIVANRYLGVRAIVYAAPDLTLIETGRVHNDANVLSVGARFVADHDAEEAVLLFLTTSFPGDDRHRRRIAQIDSGVVR